VGELRKEETRDRFGEALVMLARQDRNVIAMDCDLGRSTRSFRITEVDPKRFIEMGIAEQDMISTAAGLSRMGKIVFVNSFATFVTGRAFDQIRQQIALPRSNVKICGSSAGLTEGPDGATHQSVVDVALMRALPNMTVLIPADGNQTEQIVNAAYSLRGPVYIRLSRYATTNYTTIGTPFMLGEAQVLREGEKVVLVSYGPVLQNVLTAASLLESSGVHVGVVNFHTIKPLDKNKVCSLAKQYRYIFSIEEHSIIGGLGSALSEIIAEMDGISRTATLVRLGVQDRFGESGTGDELLKKHCLDPEGIARSVVGRIEPEGGSC